MTPRRLSTLVLALAALLLAPAAARASEASLTGGTLRVSAGVGERNDVSVRRDGDALVVGDLAGLAAGGDCVRVDAVHARCPLGPRTATRILLGDGDDRLTVAGRVPRLQAFGQDGDDVLEAGDGGAALGGGAGDDRVLGGAGDDALAGDAGDDVVRGGDGRDLAAGFAGRDDVDGGRGPDMIDRKPHSDDPAPARGDDRLRSRDGDRDDVACNGRDRAELDVADVVWACGGRSRLLRGDTSPRARVAAVPAGSRATATRPFFSERRWSLALRCPAGAGAAGCTGWAVSGPAAAAFRIPAGRTRTVRLALDVYETVKGRRIRHVDPLFVLTRDRAGHTRTVRRPLFLLAR